MVRMWPIIDDHTIDKHGESPIIDDFCTEHIQSIVNENFRVFLNLVGLFLAWHTLSFMSC